MSDNQSIGLRDTIGRALDVTLAAAGLLLLSPVFALITVAIVLENGYPVFYAQKRLGRDHEGTQIERSVFYVGIPIAIHVQQFAD